MKPNLAIFAQGAMGAGLARVLTEHGVPVVTTLDGRSAASAARARDAGMRDVPLAELADADIVLAVLPPAEALPFAERFAAAATARGRAPLYVDCNAVSPRTLERVRHAVVDAGCGFVDVGIIGLPPGTAPAPPRLYAAGERAGGLAAALEGCGLDVRVLPGPAGTASALKMSYAGVTKGLLAVCSAMILGASRGGVAPFLARELADSESHLLASLSRRVPDMLPKSYRWVAEMHEIAEFLGDDPAAAEVYRGIADFYAQVAQDAAGKGEQARAFAQFFDPRPAGSV